MRHILYEVVLFRDGASRRHPLASWPSDHVRNRALAWTAADWSVV